MKRFAYILPATMCLIFLAITAYSTHTYYRMITEEDREAKAVIFQAGTPILFSILSSLAVATMFGGIYLLGRMTELEREVARLRERLPGGE